MDKRWVFWLKEGYNEFDSCWDHLDIDGHQSQVWDMRVNS